MAENKEEEKKLVKEFKKLSKKFDIVQSNIQINSIADRMDDIISILGYIPNK